MSKNLPDWLEITEDGAAITLSRLTEINGVKQKKLLLREPSIADLRAAKKLGGDDNESQEIHLFASLSQCAPADIERLKVKDYARVQVGYFRLNAEDDGRGTQAAGQAAGD